MEVGSITICSVGDIMLCDSPLYASIGLGSNYEKRKNHIFTECERYFSEADITIGNFEGVIYRPKAKNLSELQMSCPEDVAELLKEKGFDVLNIANNHCLQHGAEAFENSGKALEEKGITTVGGKDRYAVLKEVKGKKIAFLSLSILPERYTPENIVYNNNIKNTFELIEEYKAKSDLMILSVHWGNEFALFPYNKQVDLAHRFVEAGVDIILGHHSHSYQGVEEYKGGLILYSQGNLISDMVQGECRRTCICNISVSMEDERKAISYDVIPYEVDEDNALIKSAGDFFEERQRLLAKMLESRVSEEQYWQHVNTMHAKCSGEFKRFFKANMSKYKLGVLLEMLAGAVHRKIFKIKRSNQFATDVK
jgi:poly-gamma-glutamate synthesis protein (capsule biosynthesis protein)